MDDLKIIKNKYGEKMMHLCRSLFSTILEEEGLLFNTLEANFAYSKFLYDDIVNNELIDGFKNYIYKLIEPEEKEEIIVTKTPTELLSEVGYDLYECKTEEEIQQGYMPKPSISENNVMMRCSCPSYRFRFDDANRRNGAGTGARFGIYHRKTDRAPNNPSHIPGACKHLIEFLDYLQSNGFLTA